MKSISECHVVSREFANLDLWEKRCNKSISRISTKLYEHQGSSFSSTCGVSLRQNGGRIFSDNRVTGAKMQEGHIHEILKRIKTESVLLIAQDTSHLDYTGHKSMQGLGRNSTQSKVLGLLLHSSYILTESGIPLGILHQKLWTRDPASNGKSTHRKELPITEKESFKWLEPIMHCQEIIPLTNREVWFVSDRESDVYEYITLQRHKNIHLLIRANQPRQLEQQTSSGKATTLFNHVKELPVKCIKSLVLSRSNKDEEITLSVSFDNVDILSPKNKSGTRTSVRMGVVYAKEIGDAKEPAEWTLLLDKSINNTDDALKYLDYYAKRWTIERFHYVLKQGLQIEKLQFDDVETLKKAISLYSVIAWYTHWITYLGRHEPEKSATEVLDSTSIEVLEAYTKKKILTVLDVLLAIGILGGFLGGSKRYPYPGLKSVWQGIQQLQAMKQGWIMAKEQLSKFYATG